MLSMILIARLYLELGLPQACKSYALAVAYIAAIRRDENLVDMVPAGLTMAADADFVSGAWCNALELYELSLGTRQEFIEDGTDWEKHGAIEHTLMNVAYIKACAKTVDFRISRRDQFNDKIGLVRKNSSKKLSMNLNSQDRYFWESFVNIGLVTRPFADLGRERYIRFSALGNRLDFGFGQRHRIRPCGRAVRRRRPSDASSPCSRGHVPASDSNQCTRRI